MSPLREPMVASRAWLSQQQHRLTPKALGFSTLALWIVWLYAFHGPSMRRITPLIANDTTPMVTKFIELGRGDGGRWYIPDEWFDTDVRFLQPYPDIVHYMDIRNPRSPAEAAYMALEICMRRNLYMQNTKIPLIVHQTWKNSDSATWNQLARDGAEAWLERAIGDRDPELLKMSYIFWDDKAVDELIAMYETKLWPGYEQLPLPVEKADIFRMVVLKWFGGIYVDMDTMPLKHPYHWVEEVDLKAWKDPFTDQSFSLHEPANKSYQAPPGSLYRPRPWPDSPWDNTPATYTRLLELFEPNQLSVGAIFGLEADTPPDTDDHWRSGYLYPQQLTNWAMAMAPHHPIAGRYVEQVTQHILQNISTLADSDPLELTGPPALTMAIKGWLEDENPQFEWESLSGLGDEIGGRAKIVAGDVLILPITAFS